MRHARCVISKLGIGKVRQNTSVWFPSLLRRQCLHVSAALLAIIRSQEVQVRRLYSVQTLALEHWRTQEFCSGGGQQIQLRTEDRENGDLGTVSP